VIVVIITSPLPKERVMFYLWCLSLSSLDYWEKLRTILMKFSVGMGRGQSNNQLVFGWYLDCSLDPGTVDPDCNPDQGIFKGFFIYCSDDRQEYNVKILDRGLNSRWVLYSHNVAKWLVRLPLKTYINLSVCLAGRIHFLMLGKPKRQKSVRIWLSLRTHVLGRGLQTAQH